MCQEDNFALVLISMSVDENGVEGLGGVDGDFIRCVPDVE